MAEVRQTNIKEVALAASVSVATVSRALHMPHRVSPETRDRVLAAVERLGYTPNAQARNLRTAKTKLIVALVPDISNPFFSGVIRGIEQVAHKNNYSVLLGDAQYEPAREQKYADLISARQADGLITLLPHIPRMNVEGRLPVVNACEYVTDEDITSVYIDNVQAARDATEYLLTLGHRDIAFVGGRHGSPISIDRQRGYREALTAAGLKVNARLSAEGDFSIEAGIRAVESLFARGVKFTAIFLSSDEMAIGAYRAIRARGLRVPEDISVVGFDDIRISRYLDPPLTTVAQPQEELGCEAMTMLLEMLEGGDVPPRKHILPTQFVVRGSTARPSGGTLKDSAAPSPS